MATNVLKILRSLTAGNRPSGRTYGEPYVNLADGQLGIVNNSGGAQDLLGVPIFSATANYPANSTVNYGGLLYTNPSSVTAGAFNPSQWNAYSQNPPSLTGAQNILINSDHNISQFSSGYSGGITGGTYRYYSDQWYIAANNNAQVGGQVTGTPPNSGYGGCLLVQNERAIASPAAADLVYTGQPLEYGQTLHLNWGNQSQGSFPGPQPCVLCFWANCSVTGTFAISINNFQNSSSIVFEFTVTTANIWQFFAFNVPPDTGVAWNVGFGARQASVTIGLGGGSNFKCTAPQVGQWVAGQSRYLGPNATNTFIGTLNASFYFTGVMLIPGNQIPNQSQLHQFLRPVYDEQARCFRWACWADGGIYIAGATSSTTWGSTVNFPTTMRAAPTVGFSAFNATSGFGGTPSGVYATPYGMIAVAVTNTTGSLAFSARFIINARM